MAANFHLITKRIASRTHIDQIECLRRSEGAAIAVERQVQQAAGKVAAELINGLPHVDAGKVRKLMLELWHGDDGVGPAIAKRLAAIAKFSYGRAAQTLVEAVPRQWWQVLIDAGAVKLSEATADTSFSGFRPPPPPIVATGAPAPNEGDPCDPKLPPPPGYICVGGLLVHIEDEPVRSGSLSPAARDAMVRKLIFPPPSEQTINDIVFNRGNTQWVDRIANLSRQVTNPERLAAMLTQRLSQGDNLQQVTQAIKADFDLAASAAKRIARTEGMRVMAYGQYDAFQKLGALLVGYMHNSVLDQNSRPEHAALNGTDYYFEPKADQHNVADMIIEPYHDRAPNCRCWASPILAPPKNAEQLTQKWVNDEKDEIPDPTVYDRWFHGADEGTRKEAVGVTRYNTVKDLLGPGGVPEWKDFVDTDGSLMTVPELRGESAADRIERKAAVERLFRDRENAVKQIRAVGFLGV